MTHDTTWPDSSRFRCRWPALVIVLSLGAAAVLMLGVWAPRQALSRRHAEAHAALRARIEALSAAAPRAGAQRSLATRQMLQAESVYWIGRRDTFNDNRPSSAFDSIQDEGRIDFEVALYNARTNLAARASEVGVIMPQSLGLDTAIRSDLRIETALGQLAATVDLLNRILDAGVTAIEQIQPLPPRMRTLEDVPIARLREYPVRLVVRCSFDQALRILLALGDPEAGFALERFSIRRPSLEVDTGLTFTLVAVAGLPLRHHGPRTDPEGVATEASPVRTRAETVGRPVARRPGTHPGASLEPADIAVAQEQTP